MRRVSDGYTIIEVMIFLAVSAVIMIAAFKLIDGKQAQTDFSQRVRDAQSQLQTWINNVSNGFTGADPNNTSCQARGTRPEVINSPPSSTAYTPVCVYLGEAIQFTDKTQGSNQSTIYAYPVFGCRLIGCNTTGVLPDNLQEASPEPAAGQNSSFDLTQSFDLQPLYVNSVKPSNNHLVGFYNSTNSEPSDNGGNNLNAYAYPFPGDSMAANQASSTPVQRCLEMVISYSACNSINPPKLSQVDVCLTDGRNFAQLSIISSHGIGAQVTIKYPNSLINC